MNTIENSNRTLIKNTSSAYEDTLIKLIIELYYRNNKKYELTSRKIEYLMTIYQLCYMRNDLMVNFGVYINKNYNISIPNVRKRAIFGTIIESDIPKNIKIKKEDFDIKDINLIKFDIVPTFYLSKFIISEEDVKLLIDIICEFGNMEQRNLYDCWHEFVNMSRIHNNYYLFIDDFTDLFNKNIKTNNQIYNFVKSKEIDWYFKKKYFYYAGKKTKYEDDSNKKSFSKKLKKEK